MYLSDYKTFSFKRNDTSFLKFTSHLDMSFSRFVLFYLKSFHHRFGYMQRTRKLHWKTLNNSFLFIFLSTISFCTKFIFHFHPPESIFHTFSLTMISIFIVNTSCQKWSVGRRSRKRNMFCYYWKLVEMMFPFLRCFLHEMNCKDLKILLSEFLSNIFYHSQCFLISSESFPKSIMKANTFIIEPIWTTWNVSKYIILSHFQGFNTSSCFHFILHISHLCFAISDTSFLVESICSQLSIHDSFFTTKRSDRRQTKQTDKI